MRILSVYVVSLASMGSLLAGVTAKPGYGNIPLAFEPNRGQLKESAEFLTRGSGYLFALSQSGAHIMLRRKGSTADVTESLAGANLSPVMAPERPLPGISNYFRGRDSSKWITGLPTYASVRAKSVYPGIDLVYYGNQSKLEYDFIVAPGSNAASIRMRFDGAASLETDGDGNLLIGTAAGSIVQNKPVVYQTVAGVRKPVEGRFAILGNRTVGFKIGAYDSALALTIDPVLAFSTFLGGGGSDQGSGIASDAAGNVYVTGVTFSTQNGDGDVILTKIAPDGTSFVYNTTLGGSYDDYGNSIAVDSTGSAYLTGYTGSTDFPVSSSAFQSTNYGTNNAFVARFDPTGTQMIFSTYVGGSSDDRAYALALDSQDYIYVTGGASSTDFPISSSAFQQANRGGANCFVTKFDNQGNAYWSTFIGGSYSDQAFAIAVDSSGNSYITGQASSPDYPQANPTFQHSLHGSLDAFITELSADGTSLVYSTFVGGSGDDSGGGIAVDASGTAFIVGTTNSTDLPTSGNAVRKNYAGGGSDMFVVAYEPQGKGLLFSTYLGSHGEDDGNSIALDANDNIYIGGDTNSNQFPVTSDATQGGRTGGYDATVSVLTTLGTQLQFSTFLGGSGDDSAAMIATDAAGNLYVTGVTSSSDFPISQNAAQGQPGGGSSDAFVAKYSFASNSPGAVSFARRRTPEAAARVGRTEAQPQAFLARPAASPSKQHSLEQRFGRLHSFN